jgi:hypothetical protein
MTFNTQAFMELHRQLPGRLHEQLRGRVPRRTDVNQTP